MGKLPPEEELRFAFCPNDTTWFHTGLSVSIFTGVCFTPSDFSTLPARSTRRTSTLGFDLPPLSAPSSPAASITPTSRILLAGAGFACFFFDVFGVGVGAVPPAAPPPAPVAAPHALAPSAAAAPAPGPSPPAAAAAADTDPPPIVGDAAIIAIGGEADRTGVEVPPRGPPFVFRVLLEDGRGSGSRPSSSSPLVFFLVADMGLLCAGVPFLKLPPLGLLLPFLTNREVLGVTGFLAAPEAVAAAGGGGPCAGGVSLATDRCGSCSGCWSCRSSKTARAGDGPGPADLGVCAGVLATAA